MRFSSTTRADSGSVVRYQRCSSAPATVDTMPSHARTRSTRRLTSRSSKREATMPPTTAVIVSMKAVRTANCAKVLAP